MTRPWRPRCMRIFCLLLFIVVTPAASISATPANSGDWRTTVRDFAAAHFHNPAWGYSHCERDYALARELAAADHVKLDDDVLFAAAYLHDLAAFKPWENEKLDHADVAADRVHEFLQGTGFPMQKIDAVRAAIRTHMYDRDPGSPEALYLHDADALDWLGAIGVARIIGLVDANGGKPTGPEVIPMLEENLAKVPKRVLSPAGRARVPLREHELAEFLKELRRETQDLRTL
ncbi:MAG: HD domain-containing protein [Proteobacteria bacterium]|nr:HD domain-containing protein [Pseudomonadota bacterium]